MSDVMLVVDLGLGLVLLGLVARMLGSARRFEMVVLYITFGVTMSLTWVRLHATDLALVEAAIGAGLTGALLLDTLGRLEAGQRGVEPDQIDADQIDADPNEADLNKADKGDAT
ncbi:DUF4040 domain-containing protein [Persicimonas caeni]|nr:DUF4040 domain-containing protein [Persicimonas caeni]